MHEILLFTTGRILEGVMLNKLQKDKYRDFTHVRFTIKDSTIKADNYQRGMDGEIHERDEEDTQDGHRAVHRTAASLYCTLETKHCTLTILELQKHKKHYLKKCTK